jgi:hypothetical protein
VLLWPACWLWQGMSGKRCVEWSRKPRHAAPIRQHRPWHTAILAAHDMLHMPAPPPSTCLTSSHHPSHTSPHAPTPPPPPPRVSSPPAPLRSWACLATGGAQWSGSTRLSSARAPTRRRAGPSTTSRQASPPRIGEAQRGMERGCTLLHRAVGLWRVLCVLSQCACLATAAAVATRRCGHCCKAQP